MLPWGHFIHFNRVFESTLVQKNTPKEIHLFIYSFMKAYFFIYSINFYE